MKKKMVVCSLVMALSLSLAGCGSGKTAPAQTSGQELNEEQSAEDFGSGEEETADITALEDSGSDGETDAEPMSYEELKENDVAPEFTAQLLGGGSFTLSEQRGRVVLLNFWATWCGPCVGEMPAFERLKEDYGDKVAILAVNCMEEESDVNQFIADEGYTFPVAYDVDAEIEMKYPTDGIPYTLLIGADGTIKKIFVGAASADIQYEEYKSAIDEVLSENASGN